MSDKAIKIEVSNVTKHMLTNLALDNVSTTFEPSEIHGIVGPNGAGKTTLIRLIASLLHADSGSIAYREEDRNVTAAEMKNRQAYFPQEPSLYPDLSCMEHLEFFRDLYGIRQQDFKTRAEELLEATGMSRFKDRRAGQLSGGMYKKLGLTCVLLNRPSLLLLDEPTIGVDPVSRRELWELVYKFAKDNMTVIMSTSYMDEAERCTKVHVLNAAKIIAVGEPQALMNERHLEKFEDIFKDSDSGQAK
ncbi:ABC-2 type transport system ATP-binding protein [Parelusimicrobium proximum]|uniref:ABC transporter ATP-binding protein n=1 Tax=Parelusimicrobium proximum TaxID=3228953 RepID=UPI003D17E576